jgi:hypothetical protein
MRVKMYTDEKKEKTDEEDNKEDRRSTEGSEISKRSCSKLRGK